MNKKVLDLNRENFELRQELQGAYLELKQAGEDIMRREEDFENHETALSACDEFQGTSGLQNKIGLGV
jgi:hypothetical protein